MRTNGANLAQANQRQPSAGIDFNGTRAPLYLIRFPQSVTDADMGGVLARMREVWKLRQKVVVVCDVADSSLTPRQRKLVTDEMKAEAENYSRWVGGWAIVVRAAASRHTLTALTWMTSPPFELKVFDTFEVAHAWAAQRLREVHPPR